MSSLALAINVNSVVAVIGKLNLKQKFWVTGII